MLPVSCTLISTGQSDGFFIISKIDALRIQWFATKMNHLQDGSGNVQWFFWGVAGSKTSLIWGGKSSPDLHLLDVQNLCSANVPFGWTRPKSKENGQERKAFRPSRQSFINPSLWKKTSGVPSVCFIECDFSRWRFRNLKKAIVCLTNLNKKTPWPTVV